MDYFLGEIRLFSFGRNPANWLPCNGQLLPIQQYTALFSLLGTTFGGNGTFNFGLPDLRGRTPFGSGSTLPQGAQAGTESVTLNLSQIPPHTHVVSAISNDGTKTTEAGNLLAKNAAHGGSTPFNVYASGTAAPLNNASITPTGGNQAHENRQPSLTMNYCISISGIYPSRS